VEENTDTLADALFAVKTLNVENAALKFELKCSKLCRSVECVFLRYPNLER